MEQNRLIWADALKGWLIFLVIVGHAIQCFLTESCHDNHIWNLIYSFHMPAFMALSGWMAYRHSLGKGFICVVQRRFLQLLLPYFLWSLLQFALSGIYSRDNMFNIVLTPDCYFWFLWVLFWISVLFSGVKMVAEKFAIDEIIPISVLCVVLMGVMVLLDLRVCGFQFVAYYFLFYTLGYCIHRYKYFKIKNRLVLCVLTAIWFVMAWYWKMHELPSGMPVIPHVPVAIIQYAYRGVTAAVAIIVMINVAEEYLNISNKCNNYVAKLGVYSLGIYVAHLMIMGYVVDLFKILVPNASIVFMVAVVSIICVALSWFVVVLLRKYSVTSRLFLGKI